MDAHRCRRWLARSPLLLALLLLALLLPPALAGVAPAGAAPAGRSVSARASSATGYHSLTPARVFDSRSAALDQGQPGPLAAGTVARVDLGGGGVPSGAAGVVLTVTAVDPAGAGNLRVYPSGESAPPPTSTVNFVPGHSVADAAVVATGSTPAVEVAVFGAATQVTVDVTGYFAAGASFTGVSPPVRMYDSRTSAPRGPLQPGRVYPVPVTGVPTGATAVVLTVTAIAPSGPGNLRVYPDTGGQGSTAPPAVSVVNYRPGTDTADLAVVAVPADGTVDIATFGSSVNVALDVTGYTTGGYQPVAPARILDTRTGAGGVTGPITPGSPDTVQVAGVAGVPATAQAVVMTVTAVLPQGAGNLRVFPDLYGYGYAHGQPAPPVVSVNYIPGQDSADLAVVEVPADGAVGFETFGSPVQVTMDVVGYLPTDAAAQPAATVSADENAVTQMGYSPFGAGVQAETQFAPLVAIGADQTSDSSGYVQHVFFFSGTSYLGTDTALNSPSAGVSVIDTTGDTVTLAYSLYAPGDPVCCPTADPGVAVVRFTLSGGNLVASPAPPPATSSTGPSRR